MLALEDLSESKEIQKYMCKSRESFYCIEMTQPNIQNISTETLGHI